MTYKKSEKQQSEELHVYAMINAGMSRSISKLKGKGLPAVGLGMNYLNRSSGDRLDRSVRR